VAQPERRPCQCVLEPRVLYVAVSSSRFGAAERVVWDSGVASVLLACRAGGLAVDLRVRVDVQTEAASQEPLAVVHPRQGSESSERAFTHTPALGAPHSILHSACFCLPSGVLGKELL
jgi:hypothetical protein